MADAEMAGHATEQPAAEAEMAANATEHGLQLVSAGPAGSAGPDHGMDFQTVQLVQWLMLLRFDASTQMKMEIHVAFNDGMWWAMPHDLSDSILEKLHNGAQQVSFIWDWHDTRQGSFQPDGADTSINRYIIDFDTMQQRNIDNNRTRKVKVVYVVRCRD